MTKRQKEKQSKHNAEKNAEIVYRKKANGTYLTETDFIRAQADLRRQEDEINARIKDEAERLANDQETLNKKWNKWCEWYIAYTIPRVCAGFFYATLMSSKVYLIKSAREQFMDTISAEMQKVLDHLNVGNDEVDLDRFDYYADLLDKEGFGIPEWAQKNDFKMEEDPEWEYDSPETAYLKREVKRLREENEKLKLENERLRGVQNEQVERKRHNED